MNEVKRTARCRLGFQQAWRIASLQLFPTKNNICQAAGDFLKRQAAK
jgi:hypothetical protein